MSLMVGGWAEYFPNGGNDPAHPFAQSLFVTGTCRDAGLPLPRVNAWVPTPNSGYEVDFTWPAHRLAVETDGGETHTVRIAFEEYRVRDAELALAGWTVVRFTWRRISREPEVVADALRRLLAARAPTA